MSIKRISLIITLCCVVLMSIGGAVTYYVYPDTFKSAQDYVTKTGQNALSYAEQKMSTMSTLLTRSDTSEKVADTAETVSSETKDAETSLLSSFASHAITRIFVDIPTSIGQTTQNFAQHTSTLSKQYLIAYKEVTIDYVLHPLQWTGQTLLNAGHFIIEQTIGITVHIIDGITGIVTESANWISTTSHNIGRSIAHGMSVVQEQAGFATASFVSVTKSGIQTIINIPASAYNALKELGQTTLSATIQTVNASIQTIQNAFARIKTASYGALSSPKTPKQMIATNERASAGLTLDSASTDSATTRASHQTAFLSPQHLDQIEPASNTTTAPKPQALTKATMNDSTTIDAPNTTIELSQNFTTDRGRQSEAEVELRNTLDADSLNIKNANNFYIEQEEIETEAVLVPKEKTVISSSRDGKIKAIYVDNGDRFRKGDKLLEYYCDDLQAEKKAASAEKTFARQKEFVTKRLFDLGLSSELEQKQADVEEKASIAKERVANARIRGCIIRANYDGRVVKRMANPEEFTRTDRVLLEVAATGTLDAEFLVPSKWLRWINIGAPIDIRLHETNRVYTGKIERIYGEVDPVSQSIQVRASLRNYEEPLLPGMSGRMRLNAREIREAGIKGFLEMR